MSTAQLLQYTEAVDVHPCLALVLEHRDAKWVGEPGIPRTLFSFMSSYSCEELNIVAQWSLQGICSIIIQAYLK